MEILNNIWSTLSTPNETLVNAFCIFIFFIEAPLSFSLIVNFFNIEYSKKQKFIYIFTIGIIGIIKKYYF